METQISPNMLKSDENYLICKGVKIAHTKPMIYHTMPDTNGHTRQVNISNSNAILEKPFYMSLIGKPLVNDHPDVDVNSNNYREHIKGTIINAYSDGENLIVDLVVYDPEIQQLIMDGKREVSMSVRATLTKIDDNNYIKNPVSFNHLALVDKGRAGSEYRINDGIEKLLEEKMEEKESTVSVPVSFFERLFGKSEKKQEQKEDTASFNDELESKLSSLIEEKFKIIEEKVASIEEKISSKQETIADDESMLISAVSEFIPFKKGMNLEGGVRSALNASTMSDGVKEYALGVLSGKDAFELSFSDAQEKLINIFNAKRKFNDSMNNPQQTMENIQYREHKLITASDLEKAYRENNKGE